LAKSMLSPQDRKLLSETLSHPVGTGLFYVRLDEGHFSLRSEVRVGSLRMVEEMDFLETVERKYVGRWIGSRAAMR